MRFDIILETYCMVRENKAIEEYITERGEKLSDKQIKDDIRWLKNIANKNNIEVLCPNEDDSPLKYMVRLESYLLDELKKQMVELK